MAQQREHVIGERFGKLTAVANCEDRVDSTGRRRRVVLFRCDCGGTAELTLMHVKQRVKRGHLVGCSPGCSMLGRPSGNLRHGMRNSKEYSSWKSMRERCYNPNNISYKHYGGRGITVCDRWLGSFDAFYADMGPKPSGNRISVDRIDNDGNYEPSNCRWSTPKEQANNRTSTVIVEESTIASIAAETGLHHSTVAGRLNRGWSVDEIRNVPADRGGRQRVAYLKRRAAELETLLSAL